MAPAFAPLPRCKKDWRPPQGPIQPATSGSRLAAFVEGPWPASGPRFEERCAMCHVFETFLRVSWTGLIGSEESEMHNRKHSVSAGPWKVVEGLLLQADREAQREGDRGFHVAVPYPPPQRTDV